MPASYADNYGIAMDGTDHSTVSNEESCQTRTNSDLKLKSFGTRAVT